MVEVSSLTHYNTDKEKPPFLSVCKKRNQNRNLEKHHMFLSFFWKIAGIMETIRNVPILKRKRVSKPFTKFYFFRRDVFHSFQADRFKNAFETAYHNNQSIEWQRAERSILSSMTSHSQQNKDIKASQAISGLHVRQWLFPRTQQPGRTKSIQITQVIGRCTLCG